MDPWLLVLVRQPYLVSRQKISTSITIFKTPLSSPYHKFLDVEIALLYPPKGSFNTHYERRPRQSFTSSCRSFNYRLSVTHYTISQTVLGSAIPIDVNDYCWLLLAINEYLLLGRFKACEEETRPPSNWNTRLYKLIELEHLVGGSVSSGHLIEPYAIVYS